MSDEEVEIRGEYWIQDGQVDFADGDIGDRNHEGIAIDHVLHQFADEVVSMAEDMGISTEDVNHYDEIDHEAFQRVLGEISEKLQEDQNMNEKQADAHIMTHLVCNKEAYQILHGGGDGRLYAMKYFNWIAVRSNNAELYGYDDTKRRYLYSGLADILESEGIGDDVPEENIEITIDDHKTNRSSYVTMADLANPEPVLRTNQQLTTTYNKPMYFGKNDDSEENKGQNPSKGQPNSWKLAAQKAGVIGPGQELWRGTSEGWLPFSKWLKLRENKV